MLILRPERAGEHVEKRVPPARRGADSVGPRRRHGAGQQQELRMDEMRRAVSSRQIPRSVSIIFFISAANRPAVYIPWWKAMPTRGFCGCTRVDITRCHHCEV